MHLILFCNRQFSYHAPRKNRAPTYNLPPKRQTSLDFFASRGDSTAARSGTATSRHRVTAPAPFADAADAMNFQQKLTFCALSDVKPTRIFADSSVRSWSSVRVTAWQNRVKDIHRYMMHLPFPHEGASTTLHQSQQWSRCESDRLLAIIDQCIQ